MLKLVEKEPTIMGICNSKDQIINSSLVITRQSCYLHTLCYEFKSYWWSENLWKFVLMVVYIIKCISILFSHVSLLREMPSIHHRMSSLLDISYDKRLMLPKLDYMSFCQLCVYLFCCNYYIVACGILFFKTLFEIFMAYNT